MKFFKYSMYKKQRARLLIFTTDQTEPPALCFYLFYDAISVLPPRNTRGSRDRRTGACIEVFFLFNSELHDALLYCSHPEAGMYTRFPAPRRSHIQCC